MPLSAWIMFSFGCLVLFGGLGICIYIANKSGGNSSDSQ